MSAIALTCAETPLAWPKNVTPMDLTACSTCGIKIYAPNAGSLQILTRRAEGGVGDGVNIEESNSVGADYRGQRYALQEAVFHVPGLHVFPGQDKPYPAEYHLHMTTYSKPKRSITVVIPVSHKITDKTVPGQDYFAAAAAQPDPAATRPTLESILVPGTPFLQYQGPDIRGRTRLTPTPESNCSSTEERQFLLIAEPIRIRATDLERIPREGSLSTDPRDLPAPGVAPTKQVSRARVIESVSFATPGILSDAVPEISSIAGVYEPSRFSGRTEGIQKTVPITTPSKELECKPLKVVDGKDVVDIHGHQVDIRTLLGLDGGENGKSGMLGSLKKQQAKLDDSVNELAHKISTGVGVFLGLWMADYLFGFLWSLFFLSGPGLEKSLWIKVFVYLGIAIGGSFLIKYNPEEDELKSESAEIDKATDTGKKKKSSDRSFFSKFDLSDDKKSKKGDEESETSKLTSFFDDSDSDTKGKSKTE